LEHTNAYSAFARDGQMSPLVSILKVEDKNGNVIEEYTPSEKKVLDSQIARMINSILSDNAARTYIFGAKNYMTLSDRPVAAKTGTTNDYHDAWTIGYTPSLVTGVWVGNSDNKAMSLKSDGSIVAAPIWHDYMAQVLSGTPVENFKAPDDYTTGKAILDGQIPQQIINIDKSSGLLATSSTPPDLIEQKSALVHHDILFYVDKDNPRGPIPTNPASDPQFNLWEDAVKAWASKNASSSTSTLPVGYDSLHSEANKPVIKIISPQNNQTIDSTNLDVQVEASAPRLVNKIEYYINNNIWQTKLGEASPFTGSINFLNNGYHTLKVRACDDIENCNEANVNFNVLIKNNTISASKNTLNLTSPTSGAAINSINFPLPVSFTSKHPERIAQINLMMRDKDGKISIARSGTESGIGALNFSWSPAPTAGDYTIYGELHDWNGDVISSNETKITIN